MTLGDQYSVTSVNCCFTFIFFIFLSTFCANIERETTMKEIISIVTENKIMKNLNKILLAGLIAAVMTPAYAHYGHHHRHHCRWVCAPVYYGHHHYRHHHGDWHGYRHTGYHNGHAYRHTGVMDSHGNRAYRHAGYSMDNKGMKGNHGQQANMGNNMSNKSGTHNR
jgi:hypothetical protein